MDLLQSFLFLFFLSLSMGKNFNLAQILQAEENLAEQLLNQTEVHIRDFVAKVEDNARNSCGSCDSISTCSRLTCPEYSTTDGSAGYECQDVMNNDNCGNKCRQRSFDFRRSFIRVAGFKRDIISDRQLRGICAQRLLDPFFQTISNNTHFFRAFYGSVDGVLRIYPGSDEKDCSRSYDPRSRPWYLEATKVKKSVMVLIDRGSTMPGTSKGTDTDSRLAGASAITKAFLNTTTVDDYVNIFQYDHATVEPLSEKAVRVTNDVTHPDFENFTNMLDVSNQKQYTTSSIPSNVTQALTQAITHVNANPDITPDYLKVIMVFTDGRFLDATRDSPLPWDFIKANNVNLFVYMYPSATLTVPSNFEQQFCDARGHFEPIEETASRNPLLTLLSYYSFLANIHSSYKGDVVDYTIQYVDYTEVDNQTFTLSKPAFSDNRELLGVVAINIFKSKLQTFNIDENLMEAAVKRRTNPEVNFSASRDLNTSSCLNQAKAVCNDSLSYANIICPANPTWDVSNLKSLSCCGSNGKCKVEDNSEKRKLIIGLSVVFGSLGAVLLIVCICRIKKCSEERTERDKQSRIIKKLDEIKRGLQSRQQERAESEPEGESPASTKRS